LTPHAVRGFFDQERIVIGEFDKKSGDMLEKLHKGMGSEICRVSPTEAEMVKYSSNCALALKISYWNEIHMLCEKLGIDAQKVASIAGKDKRIGKYGTAFTGKAFGGACLPKDVEAFVNFAKQHHDPAILRSAKELNDKLKAQENN